MSTLEMNKICCVEDAEKCPKSSSCSMVLRSACSHRQSRESSTVRQKSRSGTPRKRKQHLSHSKSVSSSEVTFVHNGLKSSLKELALKSANSTYSILKEHLYNNFKHSDIFNEKLYQVNSLDVSCARELNFSNLSNHSTRNNSETHRICSSDYSSAEESDINSSELVDSITNMSRTRLTRSTLSSLRSLSGSEGEDDKSIKNIKSRKHNSDVNANHSFSRESFFTETASQNHYLSRNCILYGGTHSNISNYSNKYAGNYETNNQSHITDSSHLYISTVPYSSFDKFRWFLWRCSYLKIIKNVNFDVWCLSKLHKYKKHWLLFFLLLPLLLYMLYGISLHDTFTYQRLSETSSAIISTVFTSFSSIFSWLYQLFIYMSSFLFPEQDVILIEKELSPTTDIYDGEKECSSKMFSIFSSIPESLSLLFGWFSKSSSESVPVNRDLQYQQNNIQTNQLINEEIQSSRPTREEIRLWAAEVWKAEVNKLKELHPSDSHSTQADKVEKELKLQKEIMNLRLEFKSLTGTIENLKNDILKQNEKKEITSQGNIMGVTDFRKDIDHLNVKLKIIEAKLDIFEGLKTCCDKQWKQEDLVALLEKNIVNAFKNIVDGNSDPDSKYYFFNKWLGSKILSHEKLIKEINAALAKHSFHQGTDMNHDFVVKVVESTVLKYVDSVKKNLTIQNNSNNVKLGYDIFSEDKIKKIVKEAIMLYDADKTGQVDYALESGGGSILGTRCSETYIEKYGKFSIFGVPLWTNSNSPRTAIQPDMQPGRCWAFKGSQGFLVIELSATIYLTGFTLEHIPVSLSPSGSIDSAPKNFSVWGLESDKDNSGRLLGKYIYDINGEPLQYFSVQKPSEWPYSYVELQIHSNHGNLEYTCLYRFRVHGRRVH